MHTHSGESCQSRAKITGKMRQKGADLLTAAIAVLIYEFAVFGISVGIGETALFRIISAAATGVMTVICSIGLYFLFTAIEKIGGNPWNA